VLGPEDSPLARACGAGREVVAEPITHDARVVGLLLAGNKLGPDPQVSSEDVQVLAAVASFLGTFHENVSRFTEQRDLFFSTVAALSRTIEAKDPYTRGHSERVSLLARQMAVAMRLDRRRCERYRIAGLVHDLGKIGVPEAVLRKPGKLTTDEFILIRRHPEIGYNILRDIPGMADVLPGVLHHHEQWDGRGYPRGLAAEAIPLIARVLALADTFDAMRSRRAYREAMPREVALAEISRCAGANYDPALVSIFLALDFAPFDRLLANPLPTTERCAA
jgi:HD-GYP domain-containing protein (c-di-GMP phosphodiesterase class II)